MQGDRQEDTKGPPEYRGLQEVTKGNKGLQGVTGGYKGLQKVTKGYKLSLIHI